MTQTEWLILAYGFALLLGSGAWHLSGIVLIKRITPDPGKRPFLGVLLTFWGLAILHVSEIVLGAVAYWLALSFSEAGLIAKGYGDTMAGLLYFSGINYATLGYTQQVAHGPIRLLAMLQALGGFMLITWSATFVYSIWDEQFRQEQGEDGEQS